MNRRNFFQCALLAVVALPRPATAARLRAVLYKSPQCGCCEGYATYLRENGFEVDVKETDDLAKISQNAGIPEEIQGCHTMFVEGYVVDGHVPVSAIRKLLSERPKIVGIVLPGMPQGSPGMTGRKTESFKIYALNKDGTAAVVFATE